MTLLTGCLILTACGGATGVAETPTAAVTQGDETSAADEPSLVCPNRTREEDLEVLAFEMTMLDTIVGELEVNPEDPTYNRYLVNSLSRILRLREHDSACAAGNILAAVARNCRPNIPQCYYDQLPELAREADSICPGQDSAARTIEALQGCAIATN